MICSNCNAPNRDGAKFCVGCGGALVASSPPSYGQGYGAPSSLQAPGGYPPAYPPSSQAQAGWSPDYSSQGREPGRQCGQCGQQNVESARFCTRCGAAMPAAASGYLPGTSSYPQQAQSGASVQGRKRSRGWIVAGGVVVVLLLLGGIAWLASREWLRLGTNETAQLMPAGPDAYVVINPSAGQLARLIDSSDLKALGLPLYLLDLVDPSAVGRDFDTYNIDFDRDIRPWMGLEAAAAVYGLEKGDTALAIAVATRDQALSDEFLDNVQNAMEDEGSEFDESTYRGISIISEVDGSDEGLSFATVNRFVVAASTLEVMENVIDASEDRTARLADDTGYLDVMDRLPASRIGTVYLGEIGKVVADEINSDWLPATNAVGIALLMESTGLRLDLMQEIDTRDLDRDALEAIERSATDGRLVEVLPNDTLIVTTGSNFAETWRQLALDVPGMLDENLDITLQNYQALYGVDFGDIFSQLTSDYAIAVLDDSDRTTDWPRTPGVSLLFVFDVPAEEQQAVEDAMQELVDEMENRSGLSAQARASGDSRVHTVADASGAKIAGYTLRDDTLFVAVGESAVDAMFDPEALPLAEDETYRQSVAALPGDAHNLFFVDVQSAIRTIKRDMGESESQSFEESIEPSLESLLALSAASLPVDEDGYQNTVIYLHMSDR